MLIQPEIPSRTRFENNGSSHYKPDELDLMYLFQKGLAFLHEFRILFCVLTGLGLSVGLYFYFVTPKMANSVLIARSTVLTNQEQIEMVDGWNRLLGRGQLHELSRLMDCPPEVLKKLRAISAHEIQKVYVQNNPNGFLVKVRVTDTSALEQLEKGIVTAINRSPYVSQKREARKIKYGRLIENVKNEISNLNKTKRSIDNMITSTDANTTPLMVDISRIHGQWIELNEKLTAYEEEVLFLNGVHILQHFNKDQVTKSLAKPLVFSTAAGLFLAYVLALLLLARKRIRSAHRFAAR